jgi:CheY-like chemotaxis protein
VRLPGWSGPEVVRRLRERQPGLPAVLASGYLGEEVEAVSLHDAQDVAFLTKPFTPQQLAQALELAVARAPRSTLA